MTTADMELDARGLNCPLPILKARKALKDVADGGTLPSPRKPDPERTRLYSACGRRFAARSGFLALVTG